VPCRAAIKALATAEIIESHDPQGRGFLHFWTTVLLAAWLNSSWSHCYEHHIRSRPTEQHRNLTAPQ